MSYDEIMPTYEIPQYSIKHISLAVCHNSSPEVLLGNFPMHLLMDGLYLHLLSKANLLHLHRVWEVKNTAPARIFPPSIFCSYDHSRQVNWRTVRPSHHYEQCIRAFQQTIPAFRQHDKIPWFKTMENRNTKFKLVIICRHADT